MVLQSPAQVPGSFLNVLDFGCFDWLIQLAPVLVPILEADFFCHHNLLRDVANQKFFSNSSPDSPAISLTSSPPSSSSLCAALLSTPKCVSNLLLEFPNLLSSDGFTTSLPCHQIQHHLLTCPGLPVFAKSRLLDPHKLATAIAEFFAMEKAGIIPRSTFPWASPFHMD